ncbi:MAG: DUF2865 domain-containing protein [Alphaproteobacteria bacterium]
MRPRLAVQIASIIIALAALQVPASAQGFFDWFNQRQDDRYVRQNPYYGQRGESAQRQYTPQASAYADQGPIMQERGPASAPSIGGSTGRAVAYCVRLCDGRYFPMQRHSNATSIQLCNAFCPAAKTQVFNGSQIDHAVASNGARYANLENAFVYRQKIVDGCTCNGKDTFGLAKIDVASDPTLKSGDIIATGDNQKAALAAAANRNVRGTVTASAALRGNKAAKSGDPDAQERPED